MPPRSRASKRTTSARTSRPAAPVASSLPTPGPGERLRVLDVPYEERLRVLDVPYEERSVASAAGASWHRGVGWVHIGAALPAALAGYAPPRYSWAWWQEAALAGDLATQAPEPDPSTGDKTLRVDQGQDVRAILTARAQGCPEYLLANDVGTGKTVTTIAAVKRMGGVRNVLVICPLVVAPGWQLHLDHMGDGGMNWLVINYESLKKIITAPPAAARAKKTRTKNLHTVTSGTGTIPWDVVITDECHALADPTSQQSRAVERIIAGPVGAPAAFPIRLSATAGSNPAQLAYLHRGLWASTGRSPQTSVTAEDFQQWCVEHGLGVTSGRFGSGLAWEGDTTDLPRTHALLFKATPRWASRRRPSWPDQQRIAVPIALDAPQRRAYETEWANFRAAMKAIDTARARPGSGSAHAKAVATARANGLAAQTRYRQKAGMLRAAGTAAFAASMIAKGTQVAISCEYLATGDAIADALRAAGIDPAMFTGQNRATREEERLAYQRGHKKAIIFTPAEGFNLHAGDRAVGGNTVPRVTVIAEPRWSPKKALQVEGRSQRDGTSAPAYYTYALGTVEEKVITTVLAGMRATTTINGDDTTPFDGLAAALGVDHVTA